MIRRSRKGFSLLELLLTLGIIAGLIVAAFIVYPKVQAYRNVKIEASNISTLKAEISSLYSSTIGSMPNSYSLNSVLINAKVIPENMIIGGNKIRNTWGGDVYTGTYDIANASAFVIQYNHVPRDECAKLVMETATGFEQVVVGSEVAGDTYGIVRNGSNRGVVFGINKLGDGETALNVASVTAACNVGANAFIMYKFY